MTRAVAERRPPQHEPTARSRRTGQRRPKGVVALLDAAERGPVLPLPHRHVLERTLGHSFADVRVHADRDSRTALDALDAVAAVRRRTLFLRSPDPGIAVVAHEAVHLVQAAGPARGGAGAAAEQEADRLARVLAARPDRPVHVAATLDRTAVAALRRPPATAEPAPTADPLATAAFVRETRAPAMPAPATTANAREDRPITEAPGAPTEAASAPPLPAVPEAPIAAPEAAAAQEAPIAPASTPEDLLAELADAPPTVKAARASDLDADLLRSAQELASTFRDGLPGITAALSGDVAAPAPLRVEAPPAPPVTLEATAPPPAPEPNVPRAPDLPAADANTDLLAGLSRLDTAQPTDRANDLGRRIAAVATTDPDAPTVGPAPQVPLEEASNPGRMDEQLSAGATQARDALGAAQAAVLDGPGPEQVQPLRMEESHRVEGVAAPVPAPLEVPTGPAEFAAMDLPPEVRASFDQQQHAAMQAGLAEARGQAEAAATQRDAARSTALDEAVSGAAELNRAAADEQRREVGAARDQVQQARRSTLDQQAEAVAGVEREAGDRRRTDRAAVDARVATDQATIDTRYRQADEEAQREVADGERRAEAERARAAREAEDESWWDRAVDLVAEALTALKDAINAVIDAVRTAVHRILDAVAAFATALIRAVADFVSAAIAAFGTFLKGLVDALLGELFPELAAALNAAIDDAVSAAQRAVAAVAERLTKAVNALVDALRAGLDAILDAYRAAVDAAFAVATAVLTGDWSALARMVLEAVLGVLGVDPAAFFAFVGRAESTFRAILDDPVRFVGNLVEAFFGGVRLFAGNFLTHLKTGVIGWLTGALGGAGLTMPAAFDLMGVLDLLRQIVGLTWQRLRDRAVRIVGPKAVELIELFGSYLDTLMSGGWPALFERLREDLGGLVDTALGGLRTFLVERLVTAAITRLATLFNPVGALVQLVLAAWNFFTFLRDQLARIAEVVRTVVDALAQIVAGTVRPASLAVEAVLGRLLPLALDLLARLLGLGDVGARVRELLTQIGAAVDRAVERLLQRVLAGLRGRRTPPGGVRPDETRVRADVTAALLAELAEDRPREQVAAIAERIEDRFRPRGVRRVVLGGPDAEGDYAVLVEASPLAPAVLMRLARRGASVRMASTVRFSTPQTLQTPRTFFGSPVRHSGARPGTPENRGFVRRASIGATGGFLVHPEPGARRDTSIPEAERITTDLVQVTNFNYARSDRREATNDSHAERHFISWFDADVAKASRPRLERIDVEITHSPCSLCARHSPVNLPDFLRRVRADAQPGTFQAVLRYRRPHTGDFPTTTQDISALESVWDVVTGPTITLTDEQAGRQSRHAVAAR